MKENAMKWKWEENWRKMKQIICNHSVWKMKEILKVLFGKWNWMRGKGNKRKVRGKWKEIIWKQTIVNGKWKEYLRNLI